MEKREDSLTAKKTSKNVFQGTVFTLKRSNQCSIPLNKTADIILIKTENSKAIILLNRPH